MCFLTFAAYPTTPTPSQSRTCSWLRGSDFPGCAPLLRAGRLRIDAQAGDAHDGHADAVVERCRDRRRRPDAAAVRSAALAHPGRSRADARRAPGAPRQAAADGPRQRGRLHRRDLGGLRQSLRRREPVDRDRPGAERHPPRPQEPSPLDAAGAPARRCDLPAVDSLGASRAARSHRHHSSLELSVVSLSRAAGRRACRRQPGDDQAVGADPALLGSAGADHRRNLRCRRGCRGDRWSRGRRGFLEPALRPSGLYRFDRRRPQGDAGRRGQPHAGDARARRQVAGDRLRRFRPREGGREHRLRQVPERRPDLHRTGLRAGAEGRRRGLRQGGDRAGRRLLSDAGRQRRLHFDHLEAAPRPADRRHRGGARRRGDRADRGGRRCRAGRARSRRRW